MRQRGFKTILIWIGIVVMGFLMHKFVNKDSLIYVIDQSLPGKEAGLLNGMLWGERSGFNKDFLKELQNSGLIHLVVVSGTNMVLVFGGLVEGLARWLGRKSAIGVAAVVALFYLNIVGWQIPVVRALILVLVMYWAQILGRKYSVWRGLFLSALIIVLAWPKSVMEISFWLSFAAFFAVISSFWKDIFRSSVWVSLWISPILAISFGKINLISPISNLMVVWLMEIVTVVGFLGSVGGLIVPMVGKMVLWSVWPLLRYFGAVVGVVGNWSWVNLSINFNWLIALGWYLILIWIYLKFKNLAQ